MADSNANTKKQTGAKHVQPAAPKTFYVGPTIPRFGLIRNTNYAAITPTIAAAMEETPEIRALFISIANYPTVANDISAGERRTLDGGFYFQTFNAVAEKYGVLRVGRSKRGE